MDRSGKLHPAQTSSRRSHAAGGTTPGRAQEAAAALWALFDDAYDRAGERAAREGAPACTREVLSASERRYRRPGAGGEERSIAVSLMLSVIEGRLRGGALVSTSRPYLSLFVAPVQRSGRLHWRVGTSGRLLSPALVEDLFLSVLDDEGEATRRLAPLVDYGLG